MAMDFSGPTKKCRLNFFLKGFPGKHDFDLICDKNIIFFNIL